MSDYASPIEDASPQVSWQYGMVKYALEHEILHRELLEDRFLLDSFSCRPLSFSSSSASQDVLGVERLPPKQLVQDLFLLKDSREQIGRSLLSSSTTPGQYGSELEGLPPTKWSLHSSCWTSRRIHLDLSHTCSLTLRYHFWSMCLSPSRQCYGHVSDPSDHFAFNLCGGWSGISRDRSRRQARRVPPCASPTIYFFTGKLHQDIDRVLLCGVCDSFNIMESLSPPGIERYEGSHSHPSPSSKTSHSIHLAESPCENVRKA